MSFRWEVQSHPALRARVHVGHHDSGARLVLVPRPGFARFYLTVQAAGGGSAHEIGLGNGHGDVLRTPAGTAHFLEHQLFRLPDGRDVATAFAADGQDINAFTGWCEFSIEVTGIAPRPGGTGRALRALAQVLEFAGAYQAVPEHVEAERPIILQEYLQGLDDPDERLTMAVNRALFPGHPREHDILGSEASIGAISGADLQAFHRATWSAETLTVGLAADLSPEDIEDAGIGEAFARLPRNGGVEFRFPEAPRVPLPAEGIHLRAFAVEPIAELVARLDPVSDCRTLMRERLLANLAVEVLIGHDTDLFQRLYRDGLVNDGFYGGVDQDLGTGTFQVGGNTPDPPRLLGTLREGLARATADPDGLRDVFERKVRKFLGRGVTAFDSAETAVNAAVSAVTDGCPVFAPMDLLPTLSVWDIANWYDRTLRTDTVIEAVLDPTSE